MMVRLRADDAAEQFLVVEEGNRVLEVLAGQAGSSVGGDVRPIAQA